MRPDGLGPRVPVVANTFFRSRTVSTRLGSATHLRPYSRRPPMRASAQGPGPLRSGPSAHHGQLSDGPACGPLAQSRTPKGSRPPRSTRTAGGVGGGQAGVAAASGCGHTARTHRRALQRQKGRILISLNPDLGTGTRRYFLLLLFKTRCCRKI